MTWSDQLLQQMAERLYSLDISPAAYPLVFLGGLLTNFCPCNVVLVPMVIGCVGGFSRSRERGRAVLYSAVFSSGIVLTMCALGVLASVLGAALSPVVRSGCLYLLAAVALVMGLSCLRVIRLRLPGLEGLPVDRIRRKGLGGAFLLGLTGGIVATPCTTPVLLVILAYVGVQARLLYGVTLLFTYAVGFCVPLLLAGAFAEFLLNLKKLEERTGYREWIARASGVLLIGFGLYILKTVIGW